MKKLYLLLLSLLMTFTLTGCNQQVEKASSKQSVTLSLEQTSSQDVDVYVDQDQIDTLKSQGAGTYELKLTKGNHELKVVQDGEETQKSFYVDSKETLHYQITNIENQLQIETDQVSFDENNVQDILSQIEEYSGQPYIEINNNTPTFKENEYTTKTYIQLNDLDEYGRTQKDQACLGLETLPTNKRESIGMVKPSGWKTQRYDDLISTKYLYNRCHQIGFALSGLNAEERNLMTGTRYFNVTGMLPFEEEVRDYIKNTNHHVLYEAIPVYKDDELVARGLILQAASVEDETIRFCVYVYNVQPGVTIDYQNGTSRKAKEGEPTYGIKEAKDPFDYHNKSSNKSKKYVINIKNKKYHDPNCSSVSKMSEQNKEVVTSTSKKLQQQGYSPCGICQK